MTEQDGVVDTRAVDLVECSVRIVMSYVSGNLLPANELPGLLSSVHGMITELQKPSVPVPAVAPTPATPAVSIKKSVTRDFIICLDDGRKFRSLKRHLGVLGMTPDQYRAKWGLPTDYPMIAPSHFELRSAMAKNSALGSRRDFGQQERIGKAAEDQPIEAAEAKRSTKRVARETMRKPKQGGKAMSAPRAGAAMAEADA